MTDKRSSRRRAPLWAGMAALLFALFSAAAFARETPRGPAMAAAADPRAAEAALAMLREGGAATDAAIAAMMVLGLVEPQSAGLGGGGFLLRFDGRSHVIEAYDGRERAPAGATPAMFYGEDGQPLPFREAAHSGRSIGAPSLIAMLKLAHERHGRLPWARLFEPAIALADQGFTVSPRLHESLVRAGADLRDDPAAAAYFFTADGAPLPAGFVRTNPAYAATLRAIAARGPQALTRGPIAEDIVAAAQRGPRAGTLALSDLRAVRARRLAPVCGAFRVYRVCGMGPPSSGGPAVLAILGLYARARPHPVGVADVDDWTAFLWASRLAYADRDYYMADDSKAPVPTRALIAPRYLDQRAALIDLAHAPQSVERGDPAAVLGGRSLAEHWGREESAPLPGTTHLAVIDSEGDVVTMTASIEAPFGAQRMAAGFLLNNQLTDFSRTPTLGGRAVANAAAPGKAPRSSMAPTIVTDAQGRFVMAVGSPGGSGIIAYVARAQIGAHDWGQSLEDSFANGKLVAPGPNVRIEAP
ncbi:MAG: gamma-glutamyltransferase family protein, partial [Hyphomonadaceae bacterium]